MCNLGSVNDEKENSEGKEILIYYTTMQVPKRLTDIKNYSEA